MRGSVQLLNRAILRAFNAQERERQMYNTTYTYNTNMDESICNTTLQASVSRARANIYIILNVLRVLRGNDDDERLPLDLFHRLRCRFGDCDCAFRRSFSAQNHHQFSPSFERDDDDDDDEGSGSGGG